MPVKKPKTIKQLTRDIQNGAWNNLELSKSGKRSLYSAGSIIILGALAAASILRN